MIYSDQNDEYYQALVDRDASYRGVFFVGVKTTGVFCRPGCPARTPLRKNCEFFREVQQALLAGYRPCKRCQPLQLPDEPSQAVLELLAAVEQRPTHRWKDHDVRTMGFDPSTVRRHFLKRFGVTFIAYARARRLGIALESIRKGKSTMHAQLDTGFHSDSGFRDAFYKLFGNSPTSAQGQVVFAEWIDTPLGAMLAIADSTKLILLEFNDRRGLELEIERLRRRRKMAIIPGRCDPIEQIDEEIQSYFAGHLKDFQTPLALWGTPFQKQVWQELRRIPYGETRSYAEHAKAMGRPQATRAVATGNGANQLAIIVPCHRVIAGDGKLAGYAGGLVRKRRLLELEGAIQPNGELVNS